VHRDFSALLVESTGDSEIVVVANVDIRGFSKFSESVESVEAALYIRRIYLHLIEHYFDDATFFKPTGDGLLVVWSVPQEETELKKRLQKAVDTALRLQKSFDKMTSKDPLINFAVPQFVGIGLARGAACRLSAGDKILDYSGGTLNLASRLMDIARPSGIVIDGAFGMELLRAPSRAKFIESKVYLRSVAETEPRTVWTQTGVVEVEPRSLKPLDEIAWKTISRSFGTLRAMEVSPRYRVVLPYAASEPETGDAGREASIA